MNKELNCLNCCIGDFKDSLCDCNNGMCKEYKKVGKSKDFEKEVLKRTKPKTGEWIEVEVLPEVYDIEGVKTWGSEMQCDQCGFRHTAIEGHMAQYNYCPNCGADMRGGDDE